MANTTATTARIVMWRRGIARSVAIRSYDTDVSGDDRGNNPSVPGDLEVVPGFEPAPSATYTIDVRTVGSLVVALAVLFLFERTLGSIPNLLTAIVVSGLFALGLDHVVRAVQVRFRWSRSRAAVVVLAAFTALFVGFALLVLPAVVQQASRLTTEVPRTLDRLGEIPFIGPLLVENDVPAKIRDWVDQLPRRLALNASPLETAGKSIVTGVLAGVLMLIVGVTMLLDGDRLVAGVRALVPPHRRALADRLGRIAYEAIGRYMAGSIFVALISGVYIFAVGTAIGLPLAPLIAIWVAVTSLIPQVGGALGGIPFVLLGFTQTPRDGFITLVAFLIYQQLQNNVVHPIVVGRTVKLSAATTTVAAIVGATAAGLVGALVAVPACGVIKTFYLDLRFPDREALQPERPGGGVRTFLGRFRRRHDEDPGTISET